MCTYVFSSITHYLMNYNSKKKINFPRNNLGSSLGTRWGISGMKTKSHCTDKS
jgi:hypothetical protein